jgi:hypothetical protein
MRTARLLLLFWSTLLGVATDCTAAGPPPVEKRFVWGYSRPFRMSVLYLRTRDFAGEDRYEQLGTFCHVKNEYHVYDRVTNTFGPIAPCPAALPAEPREE